MMRGQRHGYSVAGRLPCEDAYDSYRRPTQMLENGTVNLAKYSYDALNRRTQVDLGNGTRTEVAYDSQGGCRT